MGNLSIRARLIGTLILFITVFTCFGGFTLIKIRQLESATISIYDDPLKVSSAAIEARVDIIKIQNHMANMIVYADEKEILEHEQELAVHENRIYQNLDIIRMNALLEENLDLEAELREKYAKWAIMHDQMLSYIKRGDIELAKAMNQGVCASLAAVMEKDLLQIEINTKVRAVQLVSDANKVQKELETLLVVLNIGIAVFFTVLFYIVIGSIVKDISKLQQSMNESAQSGILKDAELAGNNEISGIAKHYNALLQKLRNQFWLKDGQNLLNQEISAAAGLNDMAKRSLNFLIKNLYASKGAFYLYNASTGILELRASYAFTEREQQLEKYTLGEGVIGQAALDGTPIYLENIRDHEGYIATGVILDSTINICAFPLIFEDGLYGVIELVSFQPFDELKREFLKTAEVIIAANIYSEIQNQQVKRLLELSNKTQLEASENARQLLISNQALEEQQLRLQQQSEELQQTNSELEEQQQLLQQQSEEMQQANMQLEEQQILMEEQAKLLHVKNEQLEAASMYKSQFLANMSHELRTPLNSIILLSRLLMKSEGEILKEKQLEKLDVIYSSGQELLRLINDILDMSKIEAGRMSLECEEFHTKDMLKELKDMFEAMAQEKNIAFECQDFVDGKQYGDYNKIAQILRNLISNAIKFTSHGSVNLEIKPYGSSGMQFLVADTGIGISKKNLNRIFEEFQQGDGSISRKYGGSGLGLSISEKLAAVVNGEILVESQEGKGSCFTLVLRNTAAPGKQKRNMEVFNLEEAAASVETERTILIVEDDEVQCNAIKQLLAYANITIVCADTEDAARQKIDEQEYDAVILDLELAQGDGLNICKTIHELGCGTPIIVYTGKELTLEQEREIKRYSDSVIIKTTHSDQRLLDEITLFLYKIKKHNHKSNYLISKTNKQHALNLEGKKILIADDDARNIFVLASPLEEFGAQILEAENGKTALEILEQQQVDLVLMDIMMPVMDGFQAIKAIRRSMVFGNIPIIAVTAKSLKDDQDKCIAAGANDYISKPVDYDTLVRLVKAWINK